MKSAKYIVNRIISLEVEADPEYEGELDESQQSELDTLYTILDRDLTVKEKQRLKKRRKEFAIEHY